MDGMIVIGLVAIGILFGPMFYDMLTGGHIARRYQQQQNIRTREQIVKWQQSGILPSPCSPVPTLPKPVQVTQQKFTTVSKHKKFTRPVWFVVERALANTPSPAEVIIRDILYGYKVEFYREVAFHGFKSSDYGYYRYDFLVKVPGDILLIEYDGATAHSDPGRKRLDKVKNAFCKRHGIPLVRYNKKHYYSMAYEISKLMNSYGINKK